MNSQLYTAASGLLVGQRRLEMIANNLANLSTPGYRSERAFATAWDGAGSGLAAPARMANRAVALAGSYELPGSGPTQPTGRALDVALEPGTVLAVDTPAGRRYTRSGSLQMSAAGELTDWTGHAILGAGAKPIKGLGPDAAIATDGRVTSRGAEVGRLLVLRAEPGALRAVGGNLLEPTDSAKPPVPVPDPVMQTGAVEGSAAQALGELVELIEAQRAFESFQKLVATTMNDVNRRTVNDLAG